MTRTGRPLPYDRWKRAIDAAVAAVGLVATAPLQLLIAVLVRHKLGRPVLFRQERPGKDERVFTLVKFRTMVDADPARGLVSDADRLTPFGSMLRSTSLDELPTLWNVLRGQMSLVGPRPLLVRYLPHYSPRQRRRHEVRPGITGLAQVSGRNALSWEAKFEKDVEYVDSRSWRLDLQIIVSTVAKVLRRDGISQPGEATASYFTGSTTPIDGSTEHP